MSGSRRLALLSVLGLLAAGCGRLGAGLSDQELVVVFAADATHQEHVAALRACSHIPDVVPEPIPTNEKLLSTQIYDVRFRIDHADDFEVNQLIQCLRRQPGVVGYDIPELD